MKKDVEIIVLHYTKVGDRSLVLHAISPEWGRCGLIVSVPGKGSVSMFQPMSILNAAVSGGDRSNLRRITSPCMTHTLDGIRSDIRKNTVSLFMSEVLYRTVREGTPDSGLYRWCEKCILTLDSLQSDFCNYHLRFLLELCAVMGFRPSVEDMALFAGEQLKDMEYLLEAPLPEFLSYPLTGPERTALAQSILDYLSVHTESRIDVKSLKVLHEVFVL